MKFIGNLKWILNNILGIFGKNFDNFRENFGLIEELTSKLTLVQKHKIKNNEENEIPLEWFSKSAI